MTPYLCHGPALYTSPRVLISDFGECENLFSRSAFTRRTGHTGTLEFTAPELLRVNNRGDFFGKEISGSCLPRRLSAITR